jgi:hypothetical protein
MGLRDVVRTAGDSAAMRPARFPPSIARRSRGVFVQITFAR